jgi:xylan 1,4-beta-xylosidase
MRGILLRRRITEFATYCTENNAPVDFISTHVYAGDEQKKLFGDDRRLPPADVIPAGINQARQQLDATGCAANRCGCVRVGW